MRENFCCICLKKDNTLYNSTDEDTNDEKLIQKLEFCVPEVEWTESNSVCIKCIAQLNSLYDFKRLTIQSYFNRKGIEIPLKQDIIFEQITETDPKNIEDKENDVKNEEENNDIKNDVPVTTCDLCDINFHSTTLLNKHNTLKHYDPNKWNYICKFCNTKFPFKAHLETHINSEHRDKTTQFMCNHCTKTFQSKLLLASHIRLKHSKKKRCKCCKKVFSSQLLLNCHMRDTHNITLKIISKSTTNYVKLNIDNCEKKILDFTENEITSIKTELENKDKREGKPKRGRKPLEKTKNKCDICLTEFTNKYLLNRHVRNVHATEKNHNCDICGQKFASPVYLSAHKRYHSGDRPHICPFCGKGYITTSDLYHHEKIHANKRAYKCTVCPKAFNTSSDLHKHKICVHVDRSQWKYVCNFCERRFPLKTNLDTHTKTHTGERNFACHLCERRCINRSVLLRHIESHSNVRSFKCNVCNQDYKYQKSLDIHMTKAHGIGDAKIPERTKKYFCHICPKAYFANNKLQKHIRTHTGERPFSCHLCEKRFIDKSYVKQHLKTAHNFTH